MADSTSNSTTENTCIICKLAFQNINLYQNHLKSNKHQMIVHRAYINNVKETHSIYVSDLPNIEKKEVIMEYFSEFGEIADCYLGHNNTFAFVQFRDISVVEEMLKKKLTINGKEIKVQKRKIRERHDIDYQTTSDDALKAIVLKLKHVDSVDKQLEELLKWLQPSQFENISKYDCLCRDLQEVLKKLFHVCVVYPFGSTVTGLDFAGSDVDAYVHVPQNNVKNNVNMASIHVDKSKRHLEKNNRFAHVVSIPRAKTPIVKCLHVPTQINCDFNFKNMLGVCNSYLIRYYINLDPKIKPMMVILKFWGKVHDLVGPTKFSSYSLVIMFIHFLQKFYQLPTVEVLQHPNAPVNIQDRWNGGIDGNFRPLLSKLNSTRMIDIIVQFFDFYAKFDYALYVIAPYLGCSIPRTHFMQPELLPPQKYYLYCRNIEYIGPICTNTAICVQDPFEHSYNITRAVTSRILEEFVQLCKHGHEILTNSPCLYRLFIEETGDDKFQLKDGECIFKLNMPCNLDYMFAEKKTITNDEIREIWYESINTFITMVLQKVFMSEVNISKKEIKGKAIKLDGQADVYDKKSVDCVKFNCVQRKNTWLRRKLIAKDLNIDINLNVLEKQMQVSNYISEVIYKDITFETSIFEFSLLMKYMVNPTCMEFELGLTTGETKNNDFFTFARCFVMWIPQWYNQYHENQLNQWKKTTKAEAKGKNKDETDKEIKTDALTKI